MLRILFALLVCFESAFAQSDYSWISKKDMDEINTEVDKEVLIFRKKLEKNDYYDDIEQKKIEIEFACDTFKTETLFYKKIQKEPNNNYVLQATYEAEAEYDKLLNKYFKILLNKLDKDEQEFLRQTQRNWIQFRDSEKTLSEIISKEEYSGGGTLQNAIMAEKQFSITKERVLQLYEYIKRWHRMWW